MKAEKIDILWQRADRGEAAAVAGQLAAESQLPPPALLLQALCHSAAGHHHDALEAFEDLIRQQPANILARLHRGITLHELGRPAEAAAVFRSTLIFPQDTFLRRFLRVFWPVRFRDPSIARGGAPPLPEPTLGPDAPQPATADARRLAASLVKQGVRAYLAKDITGAAAAFGEARLLNPGEVEHTLFYSWCLLQRGEGVRVRAILEPLLEESLAEYMTSKRADAVAHPHLVCEYAWALHDCGEHRAALALLSGIRPSGPDDYWAHIIAALCWTMLDEHEKADACFDLALGEYFLETWDQFLQPFLNGTIAWLEAQG